jgi:hypothetical protein
VSSDRLTRSALFNLLCHDGKDRKYLNHDLDNNVDHPCGWWNFNVGLHPSEEVFDAIKDISECILASGNGMGCLRGFSIMDTLCRGIDDDTH